MIALHLSLPLSESVETVPKMYFVDCAAGAGFLDGATNLPPHNDRITSINQIAGYAMTATGGDDTVDNYGAMIGSANPGTGVNVFNNEAAALFDTGASVMLGTGNFLTNAGTMSPGAINNVSTGAVTGDIVQSTGRTYQLDLDFGPSTADRINVTGKIASQSLAYAGTGGIKIAWYVPF